MKYLKYTSLTILVLIVTYLLSSHQSSYKNSIDSDTNVVKKIDTPKLKPLNFKGDSTKGKKILYIGDSHTCYQFGWQDQLSKLTGMISTVVAKGGMRTDWMWQNSKSVISEKFDYCMIWGGANDAASYYNLDSSISNIQKMVNLCNKHGVKTIVLTGFNPEVVHINGNNRSQWGFYPPRYIKLQQKIKTQITGSIVVQNWFVNRQDGDCGDFICHLSASGHRKMAIGIYKTVFENE